MQTLFIASVVKNIHVKQNNKLLFRAKPKHGSAIVFKINWGKKSSESLTLFNYFQF